MDSKNVIIVQRALPTEVAPSILTLSSSTYVVNENSVTQFTINRAAGFTETISVNWALTGALVSPNAGTVVFARGEGQKVVRVTTGEVVSNEAGTLVLSNAVNVSGDIVPILGVPASASYTVVDTNTPTPIDINLSSSSYSGNEGTNISFFVNRVGAEATDAVSVDWAISGTSFVPQSGTVTFAANEFLARVDVTAKSVTGTQISTLTLSNPTNLSGGLLPSLQPPSTASITVFDAGVQKPGFTPTVVFNVYSDIVTLRGRTPISQANTRYWEWDSRTEALAAYPTGGLIYNTVAAVNSALAAATSGTVVRMAAGTYSGGTITVPNNNTKLVADSLGAVQLKNTLKITITGSGCDVWGFEEQNTEHTAGRVFATNGDDNRFILCTISNITNSDAGNRQWFGFSGDRNRLCFCTLSEKDDDGNMIGILRTGSIGYVDNVIDHCWLLDNRNEAGTGTGEVATIGQTQHYVDFFTLFHSNYIKNQNNNGAGANVHTDTEVFSNKARGNMWIHNVLWDCGGGFNDRTASDSAYYANWIIGAGIPLAHGITGGGTDGIRACNYMLNLNPTDVAGGSAIDFGGGEAVPYVGTATRLEADRTIGAFNTIMNCYKPLSYNRTNYPINPSDVVLINNIANNPGTGNTIWDLNAIDPVFAGNTLSPPAGVTSAGVLAQDPEMMLVAGYYVPIPNGNCYQNGASGWSSVISVDILGNPIPLTNPNRGCIQEGYNLSVDPVQQIIDQAGASAPPPMVNNTALATYNSGGNQYDTVLNSAWRDADDYVTGWDWSMPATVTPMELSGIWTFESKSMPSYFQGKNLRNIASKWRDLEPTEGVYDFSYITSRIGTDPIGQNPGWQGSILHVRGLVIRVYIDGVEQGLSAERTCPEWLALKLDPTGVYPDDHTRFWVEGPIAGPGYAMKYVYILNPTVNAAYYALLTALGATGLLQNPGITCQFIHATSGSRGEEWTGGQANTPEVQAEFVNIIAKWAQIYGPTNIKKLAWMRDYEVNPQQIALDALDAGMGLRGGGIETFLSYGYTPGSLTFNDFPANPSGQVRDANGYLYVDPAFVVTAEGRCFGDENEVYNSRTELAAIAKPRAYRASQIRVVQMGRNNNTVANVATLDERIDNWQAVVMGHPASSSPEAFCYLMRTFSKFAGNVNDNVNNFERYLIQRESYGATTPTIDQVWEGKSGINVRRASSNTPSSEWHQYHARRGPVLGFELTDAFMTGGPHSVAIKVIFYDSGTSTFSLNYTGGGRVFTKKNSGVVRTVTWFLDNFNAIGEFAGGADFTLTGNGQTDFMMVRVIKIASTGARAVGYVWDGQYATTRAQGDMDHGGRVLNMTRDALSGVKWEDSSGITTLNSNSDTRPAAAGYVTPANANGAGDTVSPRLNDYFMESRLNWQKDYNQQNSAPAGSGGWPDDKPRCGFYPFKVNADVGAFGAMPVRWDKTFWMGMSIYVPTNWEHETLHLGNRDATSWMIIPIAADTASTDWFHMHLWGKEAGKTEWMIEWSLNQTGHPFITEPAYNTGVYTEIDCGNVVDDQDLGKWTDWVIKMRVNPFATTTDAGIFTGCRPEIYQGNRGILEVWKTFGPNNYDGNGNRQFKKVFSRVNLPMGNVPRLGNSPRTTPRIYRGNWNPDGRRDPRTRSGIFGSTGAGNPNDDGYMFLGMDCIYVGDEELHGTGFSDVNPGRLPEP